MLFRSSIGSIVLAVAMLATITGALILHEFSGSAAGTDVVDKSTSTTNGAGSVATEYQALLFDPQTSGGLLVALAPEALDAVDRGKSTDDLRAALVHASVLDCRDESLALMKRWTADTLGALASGRDATTLRAFATWKVGRELAVRRARQPGPDALATTMPKHWIGAAVELTSWLHAQNRELVDLDQPLLEAWLADGPANRARTVRPFVVWLERRDRHGLRIPTSRGGTPVIALDDRQRLAALRALLHDDEIDAPRSAPGQPRGSGRACASECLGGAGPSDPRSGAGRPARVQRPNDLQCQCGSEDRLRPVRRST